LSGKRRIGVQEFKGNRMINIREYYEKDGEMLPGKKVGGLCFFVVNFLFDYVVVGNAAGYTADGDFCDRVYRFRLSNSTLSSVSFHRLRPLWRRKAKRFVDPIIAGLGLLSVLRWRRMRMEMRSRRSRVRRILKRLVMRRSSDSLLRTSRF